MYMSTESVIWSLFVDGASRNNPGPAGIGVYLCKGDQIYVKNGWYLGHKTNNQAEYTALIVGLYYAKQYMQSHEHIVMHSDSELLVKQLQGRYKVKNQQLRPLYEHAMRMLHTMSYELKHVMRRNNAVADALANYGINHLAALPAEVADHVP
jgi:ribonuclease HI